LRVDDGSTGAVGAAVADDVGLERGNGAVERAFDSSANRRCPGMEKS
jgi:hypothetical protein